MTRFKHIHAPMLIGLTFVLGISSAFAGTGVGNHFVPREEQAFDFHLAHPKTWDFQAESAGGYAVQNNDELFAQWRLNNGSVADVPAKMSFVDVQFLLNFPAEDDQGLELLAEIKKRHPEVGEWQRVEADRGFVGWTSGDRPAGAGATEAIEYYLVAKRQVIRLQYRKDLHKGGAAEVDLIIHSIDRSSAAPHILKIWTDKSTDYQVGETACFFIEVDDLKGAFTTRSMEYFEIEGALRHWSFKSIQWVGEKNWFQVCFKVTQAFSRTGLSIKMFSIVNNRSVSTSCLGMGSTIRCSGAGKSSSIKPIIASVVNPSPDTNGPVFTTFDFNGSTLKLRIAVSDASGVGSVALRIVKPHSDAQQFDYVIFPDQFVAGEAEIDLSRLGLSGWNTIETVYAFDRNGMASGLVFQGDVKSYVFFDQDGSSRASGFPVVSYLRP